MHINDQSFCDWISISYEKIIGIAAVAFLSVQPSVLCMHLSQGDKQIRVSYGATGTSMSCLEANVDVGISLPCMEDTCKNIKAYFHNYVQITNKQS